MQNLMPEKNWNIKIKITAVFPTTLNKLNKFGIPKRTIQSIKQKEKISLNSKAELIRFKIL